MSTDKITNMTLKDFRKLIVYQKAMDLADEVYKLVKQYPDHEKYAMTSQITRATTSISVNIAEGAGQLFIKKQFSFMNNALGSANEVICWLEHANRRGYISKEQEVRLEGETQKVVRILLGYMKKLKVDME